MEIRLPVAYEIARLSDGEVVFEGTRPGVERSGRRGRVHGDRRVNVHGGQPVIFGRTAVSAVTDRYAYLATTDSITITRYDEAGTAVEVSSFEQPRESAEAAWVRFVSDSTRAHIESKGPGLMDIDGRNFVEVMTEFSLGLLEDLPARPTLPAFSCYEGRSRRPSVDPGVPQPASGPGGLGRVQRGVGTEEADRDAHEPARSGYFGGPGTRQGKGRP